MSGEGLDRSGSRGSSPILSKASKHSMPLLYGVRLRRGDLSLGNPHKTMFRNGGDFVKMRHFVRADVLMTINLIEVYFDRVKDDS